MAFWGLMAGTAANIRGKIFINVISSKRNVVEIHKCPRRSTQRAKIMEACYGPRHNTDSYSCLFFLITFWKCAQEN